MARVASWVLVEVRSTTTGRTPHDFTWTEVVASTEAGYVSPGPNARGLRTLRAALLTNSPAQTIVRRGARAGLLPRSVFERIQPHGSHPVSTPAGNILTYVADERDILARSVVWPSEWEATSLPLFSNLARDARVVLDVGAFTGMYSMIAALDAPSARVIAFEPNPRILPNLHRNLDVNRLNDRVRVIEAAVCDAPGPATLTVPDDTTAAQIGSGTTGERIAVEATTLDLAIAESSVDLIKIDIEGIEAAALRGATTLLGRDRPHILVELLTADAFDQVSEILAGFGYRRPSHLSREGARQVRRVVDQPGFANYYYPRPR